MTLLSLLVVSSLLFLCNSERLPSFPTSTQIEPRVLINSLPRSGSTFLGHLFRKNPGSAYLFEAERAIGEVFIEDGCAATPDDHLAQVITQMFACNYTLLKEYMSSVSKTKGERELLYTWEHTEGLSDPYRCSAKDPYEAMFATKEIIFYAPKLKWLLDSVGSSLKIIWLVRDIRGFVSSFVPSEGEQFYQSWKINQRDLWKPYSNCKYNQTVDKSFMELLSNKSATPYKRMAAWWVMEQLTMRHYLSSIPRSNWMLVRYEDLSLEPIETAESIYKFLGKEMPEKVVTWLIKSTEGNSDDATERYGTLRNSAKMASIYLERIPKHQLKNIETMAGELMDYFGYTRTV